MRNCELLHIYYLCRANGMKYETAVSLLIAASTPVLGYEIEKFRNHCLIYLMGDFLSFYL